jgi:hypothetical protein
MTPQFDVFELLAAADPARRAATFDPGSARGQAVLARAYATETSVTPVTPLSTTRRRRRVVAVLVAAAVAAAAAAWVYRRTPTHTVNVGCYAEARLDASTFVVDARPGQAVQACAQLWREGVFGPTTGSPAGTAPALAACTLSTGAVGVFPGGPAACARLRLPVTQTTRAGPDRIGAVVARLQAAAASSPCLSPDSARTEAQAALAEAGLNDWRVKGTGFSDARPCATFSFDEANKRVLLVPAPRR